MSVTPDGQSYDHHPAGHPPAGPSGDSVESPDGPTDVWAAIAALADLGNDLSDQISDIRVGLTQLQPPPGPALAGSSTRPAQVADRHLSEWVEELAADFALHALLGDRWVNVPGVRTELTGLMIADVRQLDLDQGSFELIYWHDALFRVLDRVDTHYKRWDQADRARRLNAH